MATQSRIFRQGVSAMSRKNKWRTRGALQFKRVTNRYSDGTSYGNDILFIRIRGKACVTAYSNCEADGAICRPGKIWANDGLYFCKSPVIAAKQLRRALHVKAGARDYRVEQLRREAQNLDCLDASDLRAFWSRYQRATKANRLALFGRTGKGTVIACRALANYASNKATAIQCRERGHLETARQYENIADHIYNTLPEYARW
jgi:hypothetical protein